MRDYWMLVILKLIFDVASYWLCTRIKKIEWVSDRVTFHLSLALMNVYQPSNNKLLRWNNDIIEIVKILPESEAQHLTIMGGGSAYTQL